MASGGDEPDSETEAALMGRALANLRKDAGYSQAAAAERAGFVSFQAWQRYERGAKSIFQPDVQRRLVKAIDRSPDALISEFQKLARQPAPRSGLAEAQRPGRPFEVEVGFEARPGGDDDAPATLPSRPTQLDLGWLFEAQTEYLQVSDDSQSGYVEPGMVVAFQLFLRPRQGDGAVIELVSGRRFVTEYRGRTATHLLGRQLMPLADVAWPLTEVRAVYKIRARFDD